MSKIRKSSIRNVIVNLAICFCLVDLGMVLVGLANGIYADLDWYGMMGWMCGVIANGMLVWATQVWDDLKDHDDE